jgi:hypothetical protein
VVLANIIIPSSTDVTVTACMHCHDDDIRMFLHYAFNRVANPNLNVSPLHASICTAFDVYGTHLHLNNSNNPGFCLSLLTSSDLFLPSQIVIEVIMTKPHLLEYITTVTLSQGSGIAKHELRAFFQLTPRIQKVVIGSTSIASAFIQVIADLQYQNPPNRDSLYWIDALCLREVSLDYPITNTNTYRNIYIPFAIDIFLDQYICQRWREQRPLSALMLEGCTGRNHRDPNTKARWRTCRRADDN